MSFFPLCLPRTEDINKGYSLLLSTIFRVMTLKTLRNIDRLLKRTEKHLALLKVPWWSQ